MGVTLPQLRALVTVVDRASFTDAATKLGVSQSAVSHAVLGLEKEVGGRSFGYISEIAGQLWSQALSRSGPWLALGLVVGALLSAVPPSAPSTMMKSGVTPSASIALQVASTSTREPTHSLKPTGLPPANSRSRATNSTSSRGV